MKLEEIGFSLWCDLIERDFLERRFTELVAQGAIKGATSNPAIFKNSFTSSSAYKSAIEALRGKEPKAIYEALAIEDIARAADILRPLHEENRENGWVSIEVDPFLCDDAKGSIEEGERLFKAIARPNVMIKIPATPAGFEAMEALIAKGISINATLIFSPQQTQACLAAFKRGYERLEAGAVRPQAVISIFVSRLDRKSDSKLQAAGIAPARLGIINAQRLYRQIEAENLQGVRALFASTGVKGGNLALSYYVDELLHAHSVNTAPLETIEAFVREGSREAKALPSIEEEARFFAETEKAGVDMERLFEELMSEGLELFKESFGALLDSLK